MKSIIPKRNSFLHNYLLFGIVVFGFMYLYLRSRYLQPIVFADEWYYSLYSRLTNLKDVGIPSYLYYSIFGITNACGNDFLSCARALNALFFVATGPLIYLIALDYASKRTALFVTIICVFAPLNSFTVYFMPEAFYYFTFFVLSYVAIKCQHFQPVRLAALTGAILGLMSLVKVHALFLIPALALFNMVCVYQRTDVGNKWLCSISTATVTLASTLSAKFLVGYLLTGGFHLLGSFYGGQASSTVSTLDALRQAAPDALISMYGHLMGLTLLFCFVIAGVLQYNLARLDAPLLKVRRLHVYTLLMLGAAIFMTIAYTASIAHMVRSEGNRLHMRYYDFLFPLLVISALPLLQVKGPVGKRAIRWSICVISLALLAYSAFHMLPMFRMNFVDGPEIASMLYKRSNFLILTAIHAAALLLLAFNVRSAAIVFIFGFLPLSTINSQYNIRLFLKEFSAMTPFDAAGNFARGYLPPGERASLCVAGTNTADLMRVRFHADASTCPHLDLSHGEALLEQQLPVRYKWLLIAGQHPVPANLHVAAREPHFSLIALGRLHSPIRTIAFTGSVEDPSIKIEGLGRSEPWGKWSNGKLVRITFKEFLPKDFNLLLKARAYGPNGNQAFTAVAGNVRKAFNVRHAEHDVFIRFQTEVPVKEIIIEVPQPVSPEELQLSTDSRELGIGLASLEIGIPAKNE